MFARQEIYDAAGSVCAYELLYRNGDDLQSNIDPLDNLAGDKATSFVLSHLFTNLGLDSVVGNLPCYINFTRNHLLQKIPLLLPQNRVIIELLEHTVIDELLLDTIKLLVKEGFKFALDDFVFRDDLIPLIHLAQIIKIDVLNLNESEIKKQLALLKNFKGRVLAEKQGSRYLVKDFGTSKSEIDSPTREVFWPRLSCVRHVALNAQAYAYHNDSTAA